MYEVAYLTVLCDHPYLVSLLFSVLLSLHLITILMLLYHLFMSFLSSRCTTELRFAITQQQNSVLTGSIYGSLTEVL